jgi:hypothetical protein
MEDEELLGLSIFAGDELEVIISSNNRTDAGDEDADSIIAINTISCFLFSKHNDVDENESVLHDSLTNQESK